MRVDASDTPIARRDVLTTPRKGHEIWNGLDERKIYTYIIEFPELYSFFANAKF
jgi:hypothetical protein